MLRKHYFLTKLLVFAFVLSAYSVMGQASADAGKKVFSNYCAQCHTKNMKSDATGPALAGVRELWDSEEELYAWIRNSQAMIAAGHPRATELWNKWKPTIMTSFEALTDEEIESILLYIDGVADGTYPPKAPGSEVVADAPAQEKGWGTSMYWILAAVLAGLALILAKIINSLNVLNAAKEGKDIATKSTFDILTSKTIIGLLIFCLVIFAGYTTVTRAVNLGRQQGYQPEQPIKFSHATHAGINKIDCQYCHDGARRSKHSVIPSTNTCMNCHKAIKVGSTYGTAEITKIFASIGYDPSTNSYIEDYADMPLEDKKKVYTKWIGEEYKKAKDLPDIDSDGAVEVEKQWTHIVNSLTNDQKKDIAGPIEWVRIHNLPDHVYFNHAQHVTVGKVDCQDCHGTVEEMDVVAQTSPLSMGWCVNCHRQTGVQFADNPYYESYEQYHKDLKAGKMDKVTVDDIGGLECQKCHY